MQRKVESDQQIFRVMEGLYMGSEYGASDIGLLRGLGINRVINISSGSRTVPNHGEKVVGWDAQYRHYPLEDRIGYSVDAVITAFDEAVELLHGWLQEGCRVFVHCSAGLSRSASMVMAFMICKHNKSLHQAVKSFTAARGRQPACTPTYWTALMRLERRIFPDHGPGVAPTFDYTHWICDDVGGQGEDNRSTGLQIATDETVAQLLHNEHDWDADAVVHALL